MTTVLSSIFRGFNSRCTHRPVARFGISRYHDKSMQVPPRLTAPRCKALSFTNGLPGGQNIDFVPSAFQQPARRFISSSQVAFAATNSPKSTARRLIDHWQRIVALAHHYRRIGYFWAFWTCAWYAYIYSVWSTSREVVDLTGRTRYAGTGTDHQVLQRHRDEEEAYMKSESFQRRRLSEESPMLRRVQSIFEQLTTSCGLQVHGREVIIVDGWRLSKHDEQCKSRVAMTVIKICLLMSA
jgi:hypothetical protein